MKSKSAVGTTEAKKPQKGSLYGHVAGEESDSENSSVYHEPYKLLPNAKQEYGCLLKKDGGVSSSKSGGDYTGWSFLMSCRSGVRAKRDFCTSNKTKQSCGGASGKQNRRKTGLGNICVS